MSRKSWTKSQRRKNVRQRSRDAVDRRMGIQRVQGQQHNWFPHPEFVDDGPQWQTDGHIEWQFDFNDGLPPSRYDRQILRKVNWKTEGF